MTHAPANVEEVLEGFQAKIDEWTTAMRFKTPEHECHAMASSIIQDIARCDHMYIGHSKGVQDGEKEESNVGEGS